MREQNQSYATLLSKSGLDHSDRLALFCFLTGKSRAWLIAHDREIADEDFIARFSLLQQRRLAGEPIAYLTGRREFFGRDFKVSPAVLIPRPDTELLVELALVHAPDRAHVLDMGTGSGCIPVSLKLERPDLTLSAVDISSEALDIARHNAQTLNAPVRFLQSNWFEALAGEKFDLIVSNPPYIEQDDPHLAQGDLRFEPRHALTDEDDGLAHLRIIVAQASAHLQAGGWLLFEHGWDQGAASRDLLQAAGFSEVQSWRDLGGHERVTGGRH